MNHLQLTDMAGAYIEHSDTDATIHCRVHAYLIEV